MAFVKVWNDNTHPFETIFKGNTVKIPSKAFIKMELYEANEFRGQYHPMTLDAGGQQDPKSYKMIRLEPIGEADTVMISAGHKCMSCGHNSPSPEELEAHMSVRHKDQEKLVLPEEDARVIRKSAVKKSA